MRVLFLDIDGVLNRDGTKERCGSYVGVDRTLATKLTAWLAKTDIKIVLSSTWRNHPEMHAHLHDAGIHWISVTPDLARKRSIDDNHALWQACGRGLEINAWLAVALQPVQYAILDDNSDFLPDQKPYFVQTDTWEGITDAHLARLTDIFARI